MTKSIPLSVKVAEQSLAPDTSFLFDNRRSWIMGVLNVTPDSFYPGSRSLQAEAALQLAKTMVEEGADVLDIGGESTRPGAEEVSASAELARILPVMDAIRARWPSLPLSVDTQKAEVARQALGHGANLINDISALRRDPVMVEVAAESRCPVVLMHMQGRPESMQDHPRYADVVDEIKGFFEECLSFASRHSLSEERVILDPGIGFGKTVEHNLQILRRLAEFRSLGRPLLVGISRKSFIGKILAKQDVDVTPTKVGAQSLADVLVPGFRRDDGEEPPPPWPPEERLEGSLAAELWAVQQGARGLRVHDIGPTRRALRLWEAIGKDS